ncbi:MAG: topoisomerase IV [Clostridia bacterium]|nr:topoisomerase IV [Clostridia bacterium]
MPYAMSVIISRAIPEIDGFKPSHRKLLYTMYKMGLLTGNRTKSSNIVGQTMKLNPHGDAAIYETLVRLTSSNEALLHPLIDSKGSFGKQYSRDMAFAAHRYTEAKLGSICSELFTDIDKDTVDFIDNYDGTMREPVLLPAAFPAILTNANQGIAVGMASNICSFNLRELCETTIALMKNPGHDIASTLLAPDFPGGATLLYNQNEINEIYNTGRGSFKLRAKYTYDKKNNCIEVTEIPYSTSVEAIIDKLAELIRDNKLKEVSDVRDESDKNGLKLTIDVKRGTDADKLMTRLYKLTPLQDSFSCNFNILINSSPRVMGIAEILSEWISFRMNSVKRRVAFDIKKKEEKLHLLLGLKKILLDIDKAIKIVRETEDDAQVVPNLMSGFGIDKIQAEYVAEIKLRNLNKQYILKRTAETDELAKEIEDLKYVLGSDKEIKKIITADLKRISTKYGQDRKTLIIKEDEVEHYTEEKYIEDYNLKVFLTRANYLKKISLVSLRSAADHKLKEDDEIICEYESTNKCDLLLFSDKQTVYKVKLYDLPDCKASAMGEYLPNILGLEPDEKIVYAIPTEKYEGIMLFAFENGKVAKVPLAAYETKLNRKKLANAYGAASPLASALFLPADGDIVLTTSAEKILTASTADIPLKTTRSTQGVQVMRLKKGSVLSSMTDIASSALAAPESYRARNLPSGGYYPKDDDAPQTTMF